MTEKSQDHVRASYDAVASVYAREIVGVDRKPFDRERLDEFVRLVGRGGPVWDLGCGPGDATRYLHDSGLDVQGVDLSAAMIEEARRLHPTLRFERGDLANLQAADGSLAGIVAFYSLIHVPPARLPAVLGGFRRALRADGWLLVALHAGASVTHLDEWWGRAVSLDTYFYDLDTVSAAMVEASFTIDHVWQRAPSPDIEFPSERLYVRARAGKR